MGTGNSEILWYIREVAIDTILILCCKDKWIQKLDYHTAENI